MMAPNLLARFRPLSDPAEASIYETIREHDEGADNSDDESPRFSAGTCTATSTF